MNYSDVIRIRSFRNLWLGQAISQLGDAFYFVIFMFMVGKITGNPAMVGFVGAVDTLPYLLFSVYAGTLADRIDRRKIMLWGDLLCGMSLFLFAAVIWFDATPQVWTIFAISFFLSTVRVFFFPAKNAAIPALVPTKKLLTANALSMATQNVMPMISLSLSASVLALLYDRSPTLFFLSSVLLNAFSFLGSALFVFLLPPVKPGREEEPKHPLQEMRDGLRYILNRRVLVVLMVLSFFMNLLISPFFVVYIAVNNAWFGGKPGTLAWLEFAFFFGMVACSFFLGKARIQRPGVSLSLGLAAVGFCIVGMAYTPWFWPFFLLNFLCGIAVPFADIPMGTYIQASTPDAFRGRVNSVLTMVRVGVMPIGYSLGGLLVDRIGVTSVFWIMGFGMAASALGGLLDSKFRSARMDEAIPVDGSLAAA